MNFMRKKSIYLCTYHIYKIAYVNLLKDNLNKFVTELIEKFINDFFVRRNETFGLVCDI